MHISKKAARRGCIVLLSRSYVLILNIPTAPEEFCAGLLGIKPESKILPGSQFILQDCNMDKGNHHSTYFSKRNGHMHQSHGVYTFCCQKQVRLKGTLRRQIRNRQ